jgi:hypothetical protein
VSLDSNRRSRGAAREGFDSTVDLFGEQSVQALVTVLQLASMAGSALLLLLLSVRQIGQAARRGRPVPALVPRRTGLRARPDVSDAASSAGLRSCLPARASPLPDSGIPAPRPQPTRSRAVNDPLHRPDSARRPDGVLPRR